MTIRGAIWGLCGSRGIDSSLHRRRSIRSLTPGVLIAGVGNIFLGDDGFGSEVARRLAAKNWPEDVRVVDYGIRGFDLAYALMDSYELTILIDATPGGQEPGTVYTMEPDLSEAEEQELGIETHGMNPMKVLQMVRSMGGQFGRVLLVGCEPLTLGGEEGHMGLSEPVANAVEEAISVVESLVRRTDERYLESPYGGHGGCNVDFGAA